MRTTRRVLVAGAALFGMAAGGAGLPALGGEPLAITPVAAQPIDATSAVQKANAALNGLVTMTATFSQTGGDGRRLTGNLYAQRPGRVRFEYDKPSTMEVVSDGSTVLVRDRRLNTSDPYPISQTPLKFLLASNIDLSRDTRLESVGQSGGGVQISIIDSSTLGGTSRIVLNFDQQIQNLRGWRVTDPQGYTTTVSLSGVQKNAAIDPRMFNFGFMRPVN